MTCRRYAGRSCASLHRGSRHLAAVLAAIAMLAFTAVRAAGQAKGMPRSGAELIERMHARYDGKWYRTLTFVQRTTLRRPDGAEQAQTWYEALRVPSSLRIDIGPPAEGNGLMFTADSTYLVRGGKMARAVPEGNPLIPFVSSVYTQPVAVTLRELARNKYDMTAVRGDTWNGRPVIIVGAKTADDLTAPQFWIDAERLIVLRMLLPVGQDATAKTEDIRFDKYVPLGGGWLAAEIEVRVGDAVVQKEEYTDYRAGVTVAPDLFDVSKWTSAPHWAGVPARP